MVYRPENGNHQGAAQIGLFLGACLFLPVAFVPMDGMDVATRVGCFLFAAFVFFGSLHSLKGYWFVDELVCHSKGLLIKADKQRFEFTWDQLKLLKEVRSHDGVGYWIHLDGRRPIILEDCGEGRRFLYECARVSGVRVTVSGIVG